MKRLIITLSLIFITISYANAKENQELSLDTLKYNSIIANAPHPDDISVLRSHNALGLNFIYLGETGGVDVWFSIKDGVVQVLSTTLDGKSLIAGPVYDSEGENIILKKVKETFPNVGELLYVYSQKLLRDSIDIELEVIREINEKEIAKIKKNRPEKTTEINDLIWESLEKTAYIEKGNPKAPVLYLFSDINCGHCEQLSNNLEPYINTNTLRVRYIPIGILSQSSVEGVLSLLSSKNASAAWDDYFKNGNDHVLQTPPTEEGAEKLKRNLETFERWKLKGTPSLFYKDKTGDVKFLYGQPNNIKEFINDIRR